MECSFRSALAVVLLALTVAGPVAVAAQPAPLPTPHAAVTAQRAGAHVTQASSTADSAAHPTAALPKLPDRIGSMKKDRYLEVFGGAAVLLGVFVIGGDAGGALAVLGGTAAVYGLYLGYK